MQIARNSESTLLTTRAAAVVFLIFCASNVCASVKVAVASSQQTNGVMYSYTISNLGTDRIVALHIGFDYLHGVPELRTAPVGWTPDNGIPNSSVSSPVGWSATIVTLEESDAFDLEWISDASGAFDIAAHTTVAGFAIRISSPSAEYLNAKYDVVLGSGEHLYGQVEPSNGRRRAVAH